MIANEFEQIVDNFNHLDLDNQEYLFNIFQKQIIEKKRANLIDDINKAENNILAGIFKTGSVEELLADIEN